MTSLDAQCLSTSTIVAQSVLDDAHWQAFGYKRRPRRGKLFRGLVGTSKLKRETTLTHELWTASFAAIFCWALTARQYNHRVAFIAKLMEYRVDRLGEPLWTPLRFEIRRDAIEFLQRACCDYAGVDQNDRGWVFLEGCFAPMTQQPPKEWLVGTAFLFAHSNSFALISGLVMTQAGVADNPDYDIEVDDPAFVSITTKLFLEYGR